MLLFLLYFVFNKCSPGAEETSFINIKNLLNSCVYIYIYIYIYIMRYFVIPETLCKYLNADATRSVLCIVAF